MPIFQTESRDKADVIREKNDGRTASDPLIINEYSCV